MKKKIALLSNVNIDYVARELSKFFLVWKPEGYGSIWEQQLDAESSFNKFSPDIVIFLVDAQQLFDGKLTQNSMKKTVEGWFRLFRDCWKESRVYLISDILFRNEGVADTDEFIFDFTENHWKKCLLQETVKNGNVHRFHLCNIIMEVGRENFYSNISWYLGRMPYTRKGYQVIIEKIRTQVMNMSRIPKKVLVLDLDNVLWGGVLGELGEEGIVLSDDNIGAIYRDAQKLISQMKQRGVLLAICSKNNIEDVQLVWDKNPYMILQKDDFVICEINWKDKVDNLRMIANRLNIGMDSIVFVDDMDVERENIKSRLPLVAVPEFPTQVENLPDFFRSIYINYFQKDCCTREDLNKTKEYHQNERRNELQERIDYKTFLRALELKTWKVNVDDERMKRIIQLINKTNQFNLTTKRYTEGELREKISSGWKLYAWRVSDKFGDYGLVAVALVNLEIPIIDTFLMSCRIMGKQMENYFLEEIEQDMRKMGKEILRGIYIPSTKNMPVKDFYDRMGYYVVSNEREIITYEIQLDKCPSREYAVNYSWKEGKINGN